MNKVIWCGDEYDHYTNDEGYDVLEKTDKDGFFTRLIFTATMTTEEAEQVVIDTLLG